MRRAAAALAATAAVLAAPAAAHAALEVTVDPPQASYGDAHHVTGRTTDPAGAPLARQPVTLEAREYPFRGPFHPVANATSDADGRVSFAGVRLDRNADVRIALAGGEVSGIARALTYPRFELRFKPAGRNRVRLTQTYRTPRDVRLREPTVFYLGPKGAERSFRRARARTRRTSPGHFKSRTVVRLPRAWHGRFRYASCFGYTKGSGMGDPNKGCAKRFAF